jgi:hypothetical protein
MQISINPRDTESSIEFSLGGYYFLKNEVLSVSIVGVGDTKIKRGHIHIAVGSFTLSYKGVPIVVDPGTGTYTRDKNKRDKMRSIGSHNVTIVKDHNLDSLLRNHFFSMRMDNKMYIEYFEDDRIILNHDYYSNRLSREISINGSRLIITDKYKGAFQSLLHFHPTIFINSIYNNKFLISASSFNGVGIVNASIEASSYQYSDGYDKFVMSNNLIISGHDQIHLELEII